jgi:hypothetical protein
MRIAPLATTVTLVLAAVVASAQSAQPAPSPPAKPAQSPPAKPAQTPPAKPAQPAQPAPAKPAPPAPAQPPPPAQSAPQRRAQPRATPSQVIVRDRSGTPLRDARVTVSGPARQEILTDTTGTASLGTIPDGSYRLRFEHEGFITLERDVSIKTTTPTTIEVALSFAPPASPPPDPAPSTPPAPPPPIVVTVPSPRLTSVPSGPPVFVSIPDFLDKNYIGRDPIKESVLSCLADSTTRVLQLHESIGEHTHTDMDEVLYVVAGEGTIRTRGESSVVAASAVTAGALTVIPHGVAHAIERRGKNPLMVLSMLSGAPCPVNTPAGPVNAPAGRGNAPAARGNR